MKHTGYEPIMRVLAQLCSRRKWLTKAEANHALETMLPPEFFLRRWEQAKYAYIQTVDQFRTWQLAGAVGYMVKRAYVVRQWQDKPNAAGSRWRIRLTERGEQKLKAHVPQN